MQTLVEIGPPNASQGQHRRKDATEQMKNLTLARTRTQVPGFSSADALTTKLRVPVVEPEFRQGFAYFNNNVDLKRHVIIRTAILYNEINSGQIMKNTIYIYV